MNRQVHTFCEKADGTRNRTVTWSEQVEVQVCSRCGADDDDVAKAARQIADFASEVDLHNNAMRAAAEREADLRKRLADALRQIPPKRPARMLGRGYVRFVDGKPILLNRRERGLGEFGYTCDSWDELFRTFAVYITEHGVDEHGPWWAADPLPTPPAWKEE
jgi:hypothetical protein